MPSRGIAKGRMLLSGEWGRSPANRILHERYFDAPERRLKLEEHPACLSWVQDYLLTDYREPARLVECAEGFVVKCIFPLKRGYADYLMYPFTKNCEGLARDAHRIRVAPFVVDFDEASGSATLDFREMDRVSIPSDESCFYIGGRANFLHFLVDHLALALIPEAGQILRNASLVTSRLAPWQKALLAFFRVENATIELLPLQDRSTIFHFRKLIVPAGYPLAARFASLRQRYADLHGTQRERGPNLYLSRGAMRPRHRVVNEDEVAAYMTAIGFEVLYPEQMRFEDIARACRNADIVVSAPGSANGNFFVFGRDDAILIYMVPGSSRHEVSFAQATVGYSNLLVFIDRIVMVYGRSIGAANPTDMSEDTPELYDIKELKQAISRAQILYHNRMPA